MSATTICIGLVLSFCFPAGEQTPPAVTVVCPPIVEWTRREQNAAAQAIKTLPAGHPLRRMASIAVKQRDIIRACQSK